MDTHTSVAIRIIVALFMFACLTAIASANPPGVAIKGFIRDSRGSGIPDVRIVLAHVKKDFVRETTTNKDGFYSIDDLSPGRYDLLAEKPGFGRFVSRNLSISTASVSFDIPLKPQVPNRSWTDITDSQVLDIVQAVLEEGKYSITRRSEGVLETGWQQTEFTEWKYFTGYRQNMYRAYVRPHESFPDQVLFNLDLIAQEKRPRALRPRDIPDVSQRPEEFYKTAYAEYLAMLKKINEIVVQKGGKPA